jgi:CHASE2 domain-containing sensor protein
VTAESTQPHTGSEPQNTAPAFRPGFGKRLLRALPVIGALVILTWVFGHSGIVHKLETVVTDAEMRLNASPKDSAVAIVDIDDEDYRDLFGSISPLNPEQLQKLVGEIAKGDPAVIGIDIDTSSSQFATHFKLQDWGPRIVWERELREVPEEVTDSDNLDPLDILGGQTNIDPAKNSSGLPLLIDDAEDKVTRRYRRSISTRIGILPSFPFAIATAYLQNKPQALAKLEESPRDLLIRYSGNRGGSHRLHFSAKKVAELSEHWPEASPFRGKIVLLGGSYLGQDKHSTPIGQLTGLGIMANVIETELAGGGDKAPSQAVLFLLELFEAFVLILLFHVLRLRFAMVWSVVLIPAMAIFCSKLAFGDSHHFAEFLFLLLGLLVFELYEHFRRTTIPKVYHDITGASHS